MTGPGEQADTTLVALVRDGRIDAFEELYDRYCDRVYRIARYVCRDEGRSEEAVQETFLAVWRKSDSYSPGRGSVAAWLLTVARNRAIDVARSPRPYLERRAEANVIELCAPVDLLAQAQAREETGRLRGLLEQLPEAQRLVIALAFYGQLSHTEIAALLGLAPGTVKGRMRLGLKKLQTQMTELAA